jgi:hypothetical protein
MVVAGDFNGDGRGDIALAGGPAWHTIAIDFGQGDGTFAGTYFVESNVDSVSSAGDFATWADDQGAQLVAGDFNGDGMSDLALVGGTSPGGAAWGSVPVALSNGVGTFTVSNGTAGAFTGWAAQSSCNGRSCARPIAVSVSSAR